MREKQKLKDEKAAAAQASGSGTKKWSFFYSFLLGTKGTKLHRFNIYSATQPFIKIICQFTNCSIVSTFW